MSFRVYAHLTHFTSTSTCTSPTHPFCHLHPPTPFTSTHTPLSPPLTLLFHVLLHPPTPFNSTFCISLTHLPLLPPSPVSHPLAPFTSTFTCISPTHSFHFHVEQKWTLCLPKERKSMLSCYLIVYYVFRCYFLSLSFVIVR